MQIYNFYYEKNLMEKTDVLASAALACFEHCASFHKNHYIGNQTWANCAEYKLTQATNQILCFYSK
jgi:hypothetical protein